MISYFEMRYCLCCCFLLGTNLVFGQSKTDSTVLDKIAANVDNERYTVVAKQDQSITVFNSKYAVVKKLSDNDLDSEGAGIASIEFADFNGDGYKDILINYYTNVPGIQDLLLYNKLIKCFVKVKGFDRYPDSHSLPGTNLYYSYHRSGCADMNWDSDLFKIVNFKTIRLGNISGVGCGEDGNDKGIGIFISKITVRKRKLVKRLPINVIGDYKDNKWGFIAYYWKHHYNGFVK